MKPLLIAVLLAIMQAPPPVQGQPADDAAGSGQNIAGQSEKHNKGAPAPTVPIHKDDSSPRAEPESGKVASDDAQKPVRIGELPPVSVRKDWADWGVWIFSGLLVVVGFLQVWLLCGTLRTVRRQAGLLAEQISLMRDTAQRQLRAYVLVSAALLKFKRPDVPEAQIHFKNFGQTPAYEMDGWIGMYIGDYPPAGILPPAPYNLRKGKEPLAPGRASIHIIPRDPPIQIEYLRLLGTPQGTIYVYGEIRYKDAFNADRYLKYRLMYGGPEPVKTFEKDGVLCALLKADAEGNEAN